MLRWILAVILFQNYNLPPDLFSSIHNASLGFLLTVPQIRTSCLCSTFLKLHCGQRTWAAMKCSSFGPESWKVFWALAVICGPFPPPGCCSVCLCCSSAAFPNRKWPPPPSPLLCQVGGSSRSQLRSPNSELCISTTLLVLTLPSPFPKGVVTFQPTEHFQPDMTEGWRSQRYEIAPSFVGSWREGRDLLSPTASL